MSGFFVLDVPEFASLVAAAQRNDHCKVHPALAGYRFVEFHDAVAIERSDTGLNEAVWYGCLTGGLDGKIAEFTSEQLKLVSTNEPP